MSVSKLPNELVEQIISSLHPKDIAKCRQFSKRFCQVVDSSVILQLHIELGIDGYLLNQEYIGKSAYINSHDLLQVVKGTRKAVDELTFHGAWDLKNEANWLPQIRDNIWARCINRSGFETLHGVEYGEAVSSPGAVKGWTKRYDDLGIMIEYFAFCAAYDLQILIEPIYNRLAYRIHFRTISTNEIHPLAKLPYLDVLNEGRSWRQIRVQILGSKALLVFAWSAYVRKAEVVIIDWKVGFIVLPMTAVMDAMMISEDLLLMTTRPYKDGVVLELVFLPTKQISHRFLLEYLHYVCSAVFIPQGSEGSAVKLSSITSTNPVVQCIKITDPEVEIIVLKFSLSFASNSGDADHDPPLVISANGLLDLCLRNDNRKVNGETIVMDWEEWGPQLTRWLPSKVMGVTSFQSLSGSKLLVFTLSDVFTPWEDEDPDNERFYESPTYLMLLDFNPRRVSHAREGEVEETPCTVSENDSTRILEYRGRTEWCNLFTGQVPIHSGLPFRAIIAKRPSEYDTRFLGGDVVVSTGPDKYKSDFFSFRPRI